MRLLPVIRSRPVIGAQIWPLDRAGSTHRFRRAGLDGDPVCSYFVLCKILPGCAEKCRSDKRENCIFCENRRPEWRERGPAPSTQKAQKPQFNCQAIAGFWQDAAKCKERCKSRIEKSTSNSEDGQSGMSGGIPPSPHTSKTTTSGSGAAFANPLWLERKGVETAEIQLRRSWFDRLTMRS
jgi:hypothetical protein